MKKPNPKQREPKKPKVKVGHFRVAIFGSARIKEGDKRYNEIYRLAKLIAADGHDIVTGGGPGIMEAANKGHKEGRKRTDIHSFGLNIMLPKEQMANKHLDVRKEFERFSERLDYFMYLSNVVVVAPGGIGTLLEFFYTLQLVQVKHICNIPIILFGKQWPELIEWIEKWPLKKKLINEEDLNVVFLANNYMDVMKVIKTVYNEFRKGDKDFCINSDKYKLHEHKH